MLACVCVFSPTYFCFACRKNIILCKTYFLLTEKRKTDDWNSKKAGRLNQVSNYICELLKHLVWLALTGHKGVVNYFIPFVGNIN